MDPHVHLVVPPALTTTPGPSHYGLVVVHPLDATSFYQTPNPALVTCPACQGWMADYLAAQVVPLPRLAAAIPVPCPAVGDCDDDQDWQAADYSVVRARLAQVERDRTTTTPA